MTPDLRVLVVCTANVCRSCTASSLLRHRLVAEGLAPVVGSAGVRAVAGAPPCRTMVALLEERDLAVDAAGGARSITRELLQDQDLVLVLERPHRAALARILPSGRARTFTLLEAAALADALPAGGPPGGRAGGGPGGPSGRPGSTSPGATGQPAVARAADEAPPSAVRAHLLARVRAMHRARGLVLMPSGENEQRPGRLRAALPARLSGLDPLDVVDVHGGSLRAHRRTFAVLDDSLERLVRGLTR